MGQLGAGYVSKVGLPMFEKEFCVHKSKAGVIGLHCQDRGSSTVDSEDREE